MHKKDVLRPISVLQSPLVVIEGFCHLMLRELENKKGEDIADTYEFLCQAFLSPLITWKNPSFLRDRLKRAPRKPRPQVKPGPSFLKQK